MAYTDNEYKYFVGLFSKDSLGPLFNAVGHTLLGLENKMKNSDFLDYRTSDSKLQSAISKWPVIVLKTDRQSLLKRMHLMAKELNLPVNAFVEQMIGSSAENQIKQTSTVTHENAKFMAVAVFCKSDELSEVTKKMSLFK